MPLWVTVVLAVVVGVWLLAASGGAQAPLASGTDPAPPWPSSGPPPSGDPAVDAAASFLIRQGPAVAADWAVLLDHMARRYDLDWAAPVLARARWEAARPGSVQANLFARVYDPSAAVGTIPQDMTSGATDQLTATALHCDRWPLPEDYKRRLEAQAAGRDLGEKNHALIPAIWAHEHGCLDDAEYARIVDLVAPQLAQAVMQKAAVDDPFVEAVALLALVGRDDLVDPAWIEAIRAAQRPDGGWVEEAGATVSSAHTTFLALWVLLQDDHPGAPPRTWIRDP